MSTLLGDSTIFVIETDDVVFPEVFPALHFDHDEVDHALILQSVLVSGGDERGFIGADEYLAIAVDHGRHAADHHPVLAAMVMHLQREPFRNSDTWQA